MGKSNKLFMLASNHRRSTFRYQTGPPRTPQDDKIYTTSEAANLASLAPKHIAIPWLAGESELVFEILVVILFVVCTTSQYINLYRTVWWLPQSHIDTMINYHLIDLNVLQFCAIFVIRGFILCLMRSMVFLLPSFLHRAYYHVSLVLVTFLTVYGLGVNAIKIYAHHGTSGMSCIIHPLILYLLIYSPNIMAWTSQASQLELSAGQVTWLFFVRLFAPTQFTYPNPGHICSTSPESIRDEVDRLKSFFNDRLKFILFKSIVIVYYGSFVPLCFVPSTLYHDMSWTAQNVALVWLSAFLLLTAYLYSIPFYDLLHRSALHLGKWTKLEARNTMVPCNSWSESLVYGQGIVVRYSKEYYRSEGVTNCAEPGNQSHLRFFIVFSNPVSGFGTLLGLMILLVGALLVLLANSHEWYKLTSIFLLIAINCITVFRLIRSYYVLKHIYSIESQYQIKRE